LLSGSAADEAFGMATPRGLERDRATLDDLLDAPEVHVDGSHHRDPGVAMLAVVPVEESLAVVARMLDRPAAIGEVAGRYLRVLNWAAE